MNDLSDSSTSGDLRSRLCGPVPAAVPCVLAPLFIAALAFALLIAAVVHNPFLLVAFLVVCAVVLGFLLRNAAAHRRRAALLLFLERMPDCDLSTAVDGQLVKVTGFASCGDISLESSYEKVGKCIYTSTFLYEYSGCGSKPVDAKRWCFQWGLAYHERFITDFFITDIKSGIRALVKAGPHAKVIPLVDENILVKTTSEHRDLSTTLKKWLHGKHLSVGARLLRLEEGYIQEGNALAVMGMLSRKNGELLIVPPPESISTGCLWQKFLLPSDFEGLLIKASDNTRS